KSASWKSRLTHTCGIWRKCQRDDACPPHWERNVRAKSDMNRHVNAIAGRLSLRPPQRHSLEILDRITEIVPTNKAADLAAALEIIRSEYPTVTDVEREVPSVCCALT